MLLSLKAFVVFLKALGHQRIVQIGIEIAQTESSLVSIDQFEIQIGKGIRLGNQRLIQVFTR